MAARAPFSSGSVQAGGATEPTIPERLQQVERLLADKKQWPSFLQVGLEARDEWDNCPEGVGEALEWMSTATVGLLDIASVGPLTPMCKTFAALIEATQGAIEVAEKLKNLICWCAFLVCVFIEHGKRVGDLSPVTTPLDEFLSITSELVEHARVIASRKKYSALLRHQKDAKTIIGFENKLRHIWADVQGVSTLDTRMILIRLEHNLRPRPAPVVADIPAAALALPPSLVEREGLVSEVIGHLTAANVVGTPCFVTGIGGGGKTILASSVVRTKEIREHFRQGIYWIKVGLGGKDQLQVLFEGMARDPSMTPAVQQRFNSVDDVVRHLTRVVAEDTRPRLVVLDDVWEREVVDTLRSTGLQLLITTRRSSEVAMGGERVVVGNMDKGEARELLKRKSGAVVLPEAEADQVAEACGWHALTLAIAGSLRSVTDSPNSASAWHKLHSEIVQKKTTARGPRMNTDIGHDPTKLSLFPVLDLSLESLGEEEQRLFLSLVVLARGALAPASMLASIWQKDDRGARKEADFFVGNSLLQKVDDSFRLHDLLLDFIAMKCQGEHVLIKEAVAHQCQYLRDLVVLRGYSDNPTFLGGFYSLMGLWRKLIELSGNQQLQVDAYNASLGELGEDESADAAHLFSAVGRLFNLQGIYEEAKRKYLHSLAMLEKVLGPDHPDVATSLNNLASLLQSQGNYGEAEGLYKRSLGIREKALGPDHPDVATSLNNLAMLLERQGNYGEAEGLHRRSLGIREKVLGPDHPDVATSLNNLASLLKSQGNYGEAEGLIRRSLGIREKVLGPDHPHVALSLHNLASLLGSQGNYGEAEGLHKRSLGILEKVLGPDHPDVATSLNNLASLLEDQGNYGEAKGLCKRSLVIREKVLGPDHPGVATSLNNLASLLASQGSYGEAEGLHRRSLGIREKVLGPDHPDVTTSLNNLALLLKSRGNYGEAEGLFKRSLGIREKVLGPDHPDVATSLHNLASLLGSQGNYDEAEGHSRRSLGIWEKVLGPDHPNVATSLNNLASLLASQGNYGEAEGLHKRSLGIWEKVLGPDHPNVATSLNNLASLLASQGKKSEAKHLQERARQISEKAHVPGHSTTRATLLVSSLFVLLAAYLASTRSAWST
eukprot:g8343.t1